MIDFAYLYQGICGLANAHRASPLAGHLGAALVAGYFFGEDQAELEPAVYQGIEKELERILGGEEAIWFNAQKTGLRVGDLFEPFPQESPQEPLNPTIAKALAKNIEQTRESGHNVIFAALAIRALHDHPMYATPAVVAGIRKLIEAFNTAHPGRGYYGRERGWLYGQNVSLPEDDRFPPYRDETQMVHVVIDELIGSANVRRQGFGGLWHLINHAAALTELTRFGYHDLARRGWAAHRNHVRLWRSLPDVEAELGPVTKSEHDPTRAQFWTTGTFKRDEARLTHRIKTLYGFCTLLRFVEDEGKRKKANENLRYLMA